MKNLNLQRIKNITSSKFILLISLYFAIFLNISLWKFVLTQQQIWNGEWILTFAVFPLFIFVTLYLLFNLLTVPYVGKIIIIILLFCSAISDYAMQNLGIVIDSSMMRNFMETNPRELEDLITPCMLKHIFIKALLPSIWAIWVKIKYEPFAIETKYRLIKCLIAVIIPLLFAPFTYKNFVSFGRNHGQVRHLINTFNYVCALKRYYKKHKSATHELIIIDSHPTINKKENNHPRVLVYVIGETARANNFSLYGYNKATNPLLQKENVVVFKDVNSCGTSTAISLPCMFSSQTQQDFKQNQADYTQNLVDIIQSAGYDIFWKDNDDGCKNVCKRIPTEDTIKTNKQPYCLGSYCYDEVLLDGLEQEISAIKKDTVIVLHTMGSHGPSYHKRYPASFEKFVPVCHTADLSQCSREEIVNAYDNTILYTDYILSEIIRILKQYPQLSSSMLYISDHGESLGENNIYLHGFPYVLAPDEQKKVPMILWLSEQIKKDLDIDIRKLNKKAEEEEFSHDNLFHSILYLLSINTTAAEKERTQLNILNNQQ